MLDAVLSDDTLMLALRGPAQVHLYYRGGRLLLIEEQKGHFVGRFDENYFQGRETPKINSLPEADCTADDWVKAFPAIKGAIDRHKIGKPSAERGVSAIGRLGK